MEINGVYFRGNPAPDRSKPGHSANFISSGSRKSWVHIAPTVTSWPYDQSIQAAPYILNTQNGEFAVMRTSNNIFTTPISDYRKHGYFSQEYDFHMDSWIDAGTKVKPAMFDEVSIPTKSGSSDVLVSFGEKQAKFMHGDTYLRKYVSDIAVNNWPNNEVGKAFSQIENLRQALMKYYKTEEAQEFIDYLRAHGLEPEEIGYLGARSHPKGAFGVTRADDGRIVMFASEDAFSALSRTARQAGIATGQYLRDTLHEEHAHIYRRSNDKVRTLNELLDEEVETKSMVRDFYLEKAAESEGKPKGRQYRKMAGLMQHDIDTTRERYTKIFSQRRESLESTVKSLEAEAIEKGVDPTEYVSAHLARNIAYSKGKIYGAEAKGGKYSGKAVKSVSKGKERSGERESHRTEAAETENDPSEKPEGNGNSGPAESQEASA